MKYIKRLERSSKRAAMRIVSRIVRTEKLSAGMILESDPRRILIIRQHNQMGDMVLAIPAIRAVKESFDGAEIGIVTSTINRDVLLNNPYVDHLFVYDKRRLLDIPGFVLRIRRLRFDLVVVLNTVSFSFTSALLALLSGAKIRIGSTSYPFGSNISRAFYHFELPLPTDEILQEMNETEHNLYPLQALGVKASDLSPLIVPSPENERWADEYLSVRWTPGKLRIVVHPGAGKEENIWAPERFASVVDRLNAMEPVAPVIVRGPRDAKSVEAMMRKLSTGCDVIKGRSIGDISAVMKRADLVLCNDTGTLHVSCAVGARTLGVFGPTDPERWAPKCRNLYTVRAPQGRLDLLSETVVFEKAVDALGLVSRTQSDL